MAGVPVINLLPLNSKIHSFPRFVILELNTVDIPLLPADTTLGFVLPQCVRGIKKEPPEQGRDCKEQAKISQIA